MSLLNRENTLLWLVRNGLNDIDKNQIKKKKIICFMQELQEDVSGVRVKRRTDVPTNCLKFLAIVTMMEQFSWINGIFGDF